jgi:hypothetical protein
MRSLLIRLAMVFGSLLFWTRLLHPDHLYPALPVYLFLVCLSGSLKEPYRRWIQLPVLGMGALSCLVFMLVIPYSVYLVWFELLAQGTARGTVSWTICILASYLSLLACIDSSKGNLLKAFLLFSLVQTVLLYILYRTPLAAAAAILLAVVYLPADFLAKKRPAGLHWAAVTWAGSITLALILANLPIHKQDSSGSRLIDHHISRQLRYGLGRYVPGFPLLYGVSGHWLGHGFGTVELGGRVSLSSRPVFSLEGKTGTYHHLRTTIFNHYSNNSWQLLPRNDRDQGRLDIIQQAPDLEQNQDLLRLTILDDFYTILPHTLDSEAIHVQRPADTLEISGTSATGMSIKPALLYGESIFLQLETGQEHGPENGTATAALLEPVPPGSHYLQVPDALDPSIHRLAGSLSTAGAAGFMDSLSRALTEGFSYTLAPGNDQSGDSFLENFLFGTKEGYCVHFATAAVILARLNGIPARYVTGYLVYIPGAEEDSFLPNPASRNQGIASGLNSHAWAELWFPGTGWLVYEATPAFRQLTDRQTGSGEPAIRTDDFSLRQLAAISGRQLTAPDKDRSAVRPAPALAVLLLVLLAAAFLLSGRQRVLYRSVPSSRQLPARFVRLGRSILTRTDRLGIPGPERTGWIRWEQQLGKFLEASNASSFQAVDPSIFRTVIFGRKKLDKADYAALECSLGCLKAIGKHRRHGGQLRTRYKPLAEPPA